MPQVKRLFFDMGSTLIDETLSFERWFQNAAALSGGALSACEIEKEYRAGMIRGEPTVAGQLKACGLYDIDSSALYPSELDRPYPEAKEVLDKLYGCYKLGIIANQKAGAELRLEQYGLLRYFDVIAASAEAGLKKPEPRLFKLALSQAGCEPGEAAMIGDRLDNDIFPAKALGFTTVRILQGYGSLQISKSPDFEPDYTVASLTQFLDIF